MSTASLQTMQKEALDVYELAQVARFKASAEQGRAKSLLSSIQATEQAARELLQKVGLAHIAGAPLQLSQNAAPIRRPDEVLATAFADVQLAQANLRSTLLRLAQRFADEGNWPVAQSVLKPLLDDQQAPLYAEALKLLQQIYLRANQQPLTGAEWPQPQQIQAWLARNTGELGLIEWLCETYYQIARQAHQANNKLLAEEYFTALRKLHPDYRDTNQLLREYDAFLWIIGSLQVTQEFNRGNKVNSVVFSPDGRWLASGGFQKVKVWNVQTGQLRHTLSANRSHVNSVAFSPDGRWLASGGENQIINLWDLRTGKLRHALSKHAGHLSLGLIYSVAFSPDGLTLASGGRGDQDGGELKLWDVQTGQLRQTLRGYTDAVTGVAFSPDGRWLASTGYGHNSLKMWNVQTGQLHRTFITSYSGSSLALSPDGLTLASGNYKKIDVWDVQTGQLRHTLSGQTNSAKCIAFSPDGLMLASGAYAFNKQPGEVKVWEVKTGQLCHTLSENTSVAFSPDGLTLASGGKDGIKLWQPRF